MSRAPISPVNSFLDWQQVLPLLDITPRTRVLPCTVRCALCRHSTLQVFEDNKFGGQWHYCFTCNRGWDALSLAAEVWKCSRATALQRLRAGGIALPPSCTPEWLTTHDKGYLDPWQRAAAFWNKASRDLYRHPRLASLLYRLDLSVDMPNELWQKRIGQLVGAATREEVDAMLGRRRSCLRRTEWADVIVVPYFDLPGRLSGFSFLGAGPRPTETFISVFLHPDPSQSLHHWTNKGQETGFAGLEAARRASPEWGRLLVAIRDPLLMLRLQVRHLHLEPSPLPLVVWHDSEAGRTDKAWSFWSGRDLLFWEHEFSPELLEQLVQTDGQVTFCERAKFGWHNLRAAGWIPPRQLLHRLRRMSGPWPTSLLPHIDRLSTHEWPATASVFARHPQAIQKLPKQRRQNIRAHLQRTVDTRSVRYGHWLLSVREGSLYADCRSRSEFRICDAVLHIHAVIHHPRTDKTSYQGEIHYAGHSVPFIEDRSQLDNKALDWMQRKLIEAGLGVLQFVPRWNRLLVPAVLQLWPPQLKEGLESIGWDAKTEQFVFRGYAVDRHGEPRTHNGRLFSHQAPGLPDEAPPVLTVEEWQQLLEATESNQFGWMLAGAVLANLLAPAYGQKTLGIGVRGQPTGELRKFAERLGCLQISPRTERDRNTLSALRLEETHGWPPLIETAHRLSRAVVQKWLTDDQDRNLITPVNEFQSTGLLSRGGWISLPGPPGSSQALSGWSKVIQQALFWIVRQPYSQAVTGEEWPNSVFAKMAEWAGSDSAVILAAGNSIQRTAPHPADSMMDIFVNAYALGELQAGPVSFVTPDKAICYTPQGVFLGRRLWANMFAAKAAPSPIPEQVSAELRSADWLLAESLGDEPGWLIPRLVWEHQLRTYADHSRQTESA